LNDCLDDPSEIVIRPDAETDHLTKLPNRRAFDSDFPRLLSAAVERVEPLALLMFDIDKFKNVNDEHGGHATGDEALVAIAEIAARCTSRKGSCYRMAGDEFAVILPNHTTQEALAVGERIRGSVNTARVTSHKLTLSLSIGVAECPAHAKDAASLKESADKAAYDAKDLGRNLVRVFGEPPPVAAGPREPDRREPTPSGLTDEQRRMIRLDYFRNQIARCPHDEVVLRVQDTTGMGQQTNSIHVSCPFCGLSEELD
jgi:diguanylate cyclase (GGDEF)-like protein